MHPAALARAIAQALPDDALAVFDGGHTTFWSNDLMPVHEMRTRFHDPGMSQLGFGLPYALSLQLQHPGRLVVNITGDGSFGFTLQELDTARRAGLPVITLIHNNAAWGIIRAGQSGSSISSSAPAWTALDYAAIARGFGCHGETVTRVRGCRACDRARASLRSSRGHRLPHALRAPSMHAVVRQHEPVRLRCADADEPPSGSSRRQPLQRPLPE